jgi:hypothetical protein
MTILERKRAMESLIFLTEKRDETIKARVCANGSTQQAYIAREEASSRTAASETILITGVIDAKQNRDVMTLDNPADVLSKLWGYQSVKTVLKAMLFW